MIFLYKFLSRLVSLLCIEVYNIITENLEEVRTVRKRLRELKCVENETYQHEHLHIVVTVTEKETSYKKFKHSIVVLRRLLFVLIILFSRPYDMRKDNIGHQSRVRYFPEKV
jgi:hypothetical protein